jgi:hypothetical protein
MIATEYDELDRELGALGGARAPARGAGLRVLPIVVGVVTLFALGGIVWYAYSQGVREGTEAAAPLLRPDSQAKVTPLDPGGRPIPGTELKVYTAIGDDGEERPVERLLPPPEEPRVPPDPAESAPDVAAVSEGVETLPRVSADSAPTRAPIPAPELPDSSLAPPAEPPPTVGADTADAATEPVTPPPAPVVEAEPEPAPSETEAAAPTRTAALTPPADAGSGWRIQIAALRSDADARAQWERITRANPDLLGGLALQVQTATVNGIQYFRVRGGPLADGDAAKALCARLKAADVACIPVAPGR